MWALCLELGAENRVIAIFQLRESKCYLCVEVMDLAIWGQGVRAIRILPSGTPRSKSTQGWWKGKKGVEWQWEFHQQLGNTALKTRSCSDVCRPSLGGWNKGAFDIGNRCLIFTLNTEDREKIHMSKQCFTDVWYKVNFFLSRLGVKYMEWVKHDSSGQGPKVSG